MNASWIEWAWLGIAIVAWMIKLFLVASAHANYRHHRHGKPVQVFMARAMLYHMCHMFVAFTICVAAAVWGVLTQPPPPPIYETQSFMVAIFFLVVNVVLLAHSIAVAQWWNKLEDGYYNGHGEEQLKAAVVTVETIITSDQPPVVKDPHVSVNGSERIP